MRHVSGMCTHLDKYFSCSLMCHKGRILVRGCGGSEHQGSPDVTKPSNGRQSRANLEANLLSSAAGSEN